MKTEQIRRAEVETKFLAMLHRVCRTMRMCRTRPDMAIPAAEWEMKINERLRELEIDRPKSEAHAHAPAQEEKVAA